jgi:chromate transporter
MIYLELFWTFFLIGAFTFGGGYAMLPLIQIEVVNKGWMPNEAVVNFVAVSESTPGPFAINMATYVGSEMGGVLGAACATFGVVLPSLMIILTVAKCYDRFKKSKLVKGAMSGLKPAVIGMIGTAILSIGKTVFVQPGMLISAVIFAAMAALAFKKVHPIIIICISAAAGILAGALGI